VYKLSKPLIFISNTPSHVGAGSDLGVVDLPIQRERYTNFPKYEASSVKGSIKDAFYQQVKRKATFPLFGTITEQMVQDVFGKDNEANHISALAFTDARILLFPVKSFKNVFTWITCPKILSRFKQEMKLCGIEIPYSSGAEVENTVPYDSDSLTNNRRLVLEEYLINNVHPNNECSQWAHWFSEHLFPHLDEHQYWRDKMKHDFAIVADDVFEHFVMLSTDVVTRVRIDKTKGIVEEGALFTEEYLPADSILYSLAVASSVLKPEKEAIAHEMFNSEVGVMQFFVEVLPKVIQIGGNETIGKGITFTHVIDIKGEKRSE
jgi:CRISPR-associated protein Cmr4